MEFARTNNEKYVKDNHEVSDTQHLKRTQGNNRSNSHWNRIGNKITGLVWILK